MDPSRIDEFGKAVSEAEKACIYLSDPRRPLGDSKHKKKEDDTHISSRKYEVSNYDTEKDIPPKNCAWTVDGFEVGLNNGISEMHHFRYHYKWPMGTVAIRRVPPACVMPASNNWTKSGRLVALTGSYNPCSKRLMIATLNH
jgi:hypothetical protein